MVENYDQYGVSLYKKILQEENMTYVHYDRAKITQPKRREGVE